MYGIIFGDLEFTLILLQSAYINIKQNYYPSSLLKFSNHVSIRLPTGSHCCQWLKFKLVNYAHLRIIKIMSLKIMHY